jgi:aminoglycoside phosphotransferase
LDGAANACRLHSEQYLQSLSLGEYPHPQMDECEVDEGILMNLPEQLENLVQGYNWNQVAIGESTAATYRLERMNRPAIYLKIDPKNPWRELQAEPKVLTWLSGKLAVPEVLYFGEDGYADYLLMSAIPGLNAVEMRGKITNVELVRLLAQGLRMVHSVLIDDCPFDMSLNKTIEMAEFNVRHKLVDENDIDFARWGGGTTEELFSKLLLLKPCEEDLVFTHGDYCLPNIMMDKNRVTGFIDLSRAGIADRYRDIGIAIRSIGSNLGPGFDKVFLNEYGIVEPDRGKIEYYILLDEFF